MVNRRDYRDQSGRLVVPDLSLPARPTTSAHGGRVVSLPARPPPALLPEDQETEQNGKGEQQEKILQQHGRGRRGSKVRQLLPTRPPPPGAPNFLAGASLPPRPAVAIPMNIAGLPNFPGQAHGQGHVPQLLYPGVQSVSHYMPVGQGYPPHPQQPHGSQHHGFGHLPVMPLQPGNHNQGNKQTAGGGSRGNPQEGKKKSSIPGSQNCSTWWVNLPPTCDYAMLFDSMRDIGAVSHAVINPPSGTHVTASARVDFFERRSAQRLMNTRQHIRVGGGATTTPTISYNRQRVAPHADDDMYPYGGNHGRASRVLVVVGDPRVVSTPSLTALLTVSGLRFQLSGSAQEETTPEGLNKVTLAFASYMKQTNRAITIILAQARRHDLPEMPLWERVTWSFGVDPCQ
ncbi:hypothetical protein F5Y17DRAFT_454585 [Xylariaceae sp. FL0594]|nr:hypothetical protein F5Y17DRAFT_454585 [Xylariaceae sp. FL0594]